MIISRAPFRVSFCGGGSDIPQFYKRFGGCVISCSIKKYVYIALHPSFNKKSITLKYSKTEEVFNFDEIEHKYFRLVLNEFNAKGIELTSIADIPSGTGLGSSSAFTVALLKVLKTYYKKPVDKSTLANEACQIEIDKAKSPIGKQDQFASAFGGFNYITFHKNGEVTVQPIKMTSDQRNQLEQNILIFYTGLTHDANSILSEQCKNILSDEDKILNQLRMCELTKELKENLEKGNIDFLGEALQKAWEIKKTLSSGITNNTINDIYEKAISAGAIGGKLLGAGGGGFVLFYVKPEKQNSVRNSLKEYQEIQFEIDYDGASVIYESK